MPSPPPEDFPQVLERIWWRLDSALDATSISMSARIGALDALRSGTTTLIDHHASPSYIEGSLDLIEAGLAEVGLRGVLCYETTDRHGPDGRADGLAENRRYLAERSPGAHPCFAGVVGAHAAFTLEDDTLTQLARMAKEFSTGVHIHVAEDACDEDLCAAEHQVALVDRLAGRGILGERAIFAHGTHLDPDSVDRINRAGVTMAHNARSNMNNSVGYAPVEHFRSAMLGTDGIGQDLFAEASAAWFIARHEQADLSPDDIVAMLAGSARCASQALDTTLGKLEVDAMADIVLTDYRPATPMTAQNLPAHLIFDMTSNHVRDVIVQGEWALRDRRVIPVDEPALRDTARGVAEALWSRMAAIV